ncbi:cyclic nucleotide-binding domain-containing protein [Fibrella forsythiae]|uniref:Cyclic nucleotide-binding domain-containing protein n=1 Tax=Fibrella forsythiae TaxID=2817061 RepID=A0ABS3JEA8_9BACT|nr:cyclic nucleotide-binding domain-containing protein [Fibrella forsythiae]MBO0948339.1 cyclic nucleotide-binding domain-containing protein [Fibrella forsythiae]
MVETRSPNSSSTQRVNRSLGIREEEGKTVRLFFLHNFLLGIGTVLVYVAANVLLLENHPETSLPIAYILSGIGMAVVGRIYAHFEHHLALQQLATRVLWSVIVLTALIAAFVVLGHSVAVAIAIMVGYRIIYLLTNLEFWAVSALVFDVRQSKRLFGVISSGDMPAKALGALLAALIHGHGPLVWLLLLAFGCYGAALLITNRTIRLHKVEATARPVRTAGRTTRPWVAQLFGGSDLISAVCLTLVPVAMIAAGIEYEFFINVKHKFHDQGDVMQALGKVLGVTYLLAMAVKALFSRRVLDKFGIMPTLRSLPVLAAMGFAAYGLIAWRPTSETAQLLYFSLLYISFEVVRRAIFDPVLLVLFQPLPPQQRLKGHTLAKGLYEPVGIALAGIALWLVYTLGESSYQWLLLAGFGLSGLLFVFIQRTYRHYVNTLQDALSRRFMAPDEVTLRGTAATFVEQALDSPNPVDVLNALDFAHSLPANALQQRTHALLHHPEAAVRQRALTITDPLHVPALLVTLGDLAQHDPDAVVRREAAGQLTRTASGHVALMPARSLDVARLLLHTADMPAREGAIVGHLRTDLRDKAAQASLNELALSDIPERRVAALTCLAMLGHDALQLPGLTQFIAASLQGTDSTVVEAALRVAAWQPDADIRHQLVTFLPHRRYGRTAMTSLIALGDDALPLLPELKTLSDNTLLLKRTATVAGRIGTEPARTWLLDQLANATPTRRGPLLDALNTFSPTDRDNTLYDQLLTDELSLTYRLLRGRTEPLSPLLAEALDYELTVVTDRILLLLMGLYDRETVRNVRQSLSHQTAERRANSLELLENMTGAKTSVTHSRAVYAGLLALSDTALSLPDRIALLSPHVHQTASDQSIRLYIGQQGQDTFTEWTVLCLPTDDTLSDTDTLQPMHHATTTASTSTIERVFLLKNTGLFADTPANVLGSIAPIMKEVSFSDGQEIVRKGDLGTSLFVIHDGNVGIYDGQQALAEMHKGDVFGELALLDAEPRSATVIAHGDVLLFRIDQDDFYDLMEERDELLRNIIRLLSRRIRTLNQGLAKN